MYAEDYLKARRSEIDTSEWVDILRGLTAVGAKSGDTIVEWGAGEGHLVRYLRRRGFNAIGYDLLYHEPPLVYRRDVTRKPYPLGDYCISQHFLEHIPQERAVELLRACLEEGVASVNIVPGHYSRDPTHVVNHYTRDMLEELVSRVEPKYYLITSDTHSHLYPWDNDWLLILSNKPIRRGLLRPLAVRAALRLLRLLYRLYYAP